MNNKIRVVTRRSNVQLYNKMLVFLEHVDWDKREYTNQRCSNRYFINIMQDAITDNIDWVINLDEDAFLLNTDVINALIKHMEQNKIGYCGVPDGGYNATRFSHPIVMNAFFNIFNMSMIREHFNIEKMTGSRLEPRVMEEHKQYISQLPGKYRIKFAERYYRFFYHLLNSNVKKLYLDHELWDDNISTMVSYEGSNIFRHNW